MHMKHIAMAALMAAASFGLMGSADAAVGQVNVGAVLQSSQAFQKAGQTYAAEQKKAQDQFDKQSKSMNDQEKKALAEKLSADLAKKEADLMKPVQDSMKAAVEKAAKDKKVDTVISAGSLMYGKVDVDLTEDVKANMK